MTRKLKLLFLIFMLVTASVPFLGVLIDADSERFASLQSTSKPVFLNEDRSINWKVTTDFDNYWTANFPFSSALVSSYNLLAEQLFHISLNDKVIIGKDGFYYFAETTDDILGTHPLTDNDLIRMRRIIAMQETYAKERQANFLFIVAPNKATIYPEFLPDRLERIGLSNLSRLGEKYQGLEEILIRSKEQALLYHKEDSHWNNRGAFLAYQFIMSEIGEAMFHSNHKWESRSDWQGDLMTMFLPDRQSADIQYYLRNLKKDYIELRPIRTFEDVRIMTRSRVNEKRLLMFRDSFANALIPYFSNSFGEVTYLRSTSNDLRIIEEFAPDQVIYELVERNLNWILQATPIMDAPLADRPIVKDQHDLPVHVTIEERSGMNYVNGFWKQAADEIIAVRLETEGDVLEAFPLFEDADIEDDKFSHGFSLYTSRSVKNIMIYVQIGDKWYRVPLHSPS